MRRLCFESHRLTEQDGKVWALQAQDGTWTLHQKVRGPGWETVYVGPSTGSKDEPIAWIAFEDGAVVLPSAESES